jgi:hypothetical protein
MSSYRNGTYLAFDGLGITNPSESDLKFLNLLRAWDESKQIDFQFVDSHLKTSQVRDSSQDSTLKSKLRERMANSKNLLVVLSENTSYDRGLLNWEIETAVNDFELPVMLVYPSRYYFLSITPTMRMMWPKSVVDGHNMKGWKFAHIPFRKEAIQQAINHYSVVDGVYPKDTDEVFKFRISPRPSLYGLCSG